MLLVVMKLSVVTDSTSHISSRSPSSVRLRRNAKRRRPRGLAAIARSAILIDSPRFSYWLPFIVSGLQGKWISGTYGLGKDRLVIDLAVPEGRRQPPLAEHVKSVAQVVDFRQVGGDQDDAGAVPQ